MQYIENKIVNLLIIFIIVLIIIFISIYFLNYQPYIQVFGEINDYVNVYLTDQEISNLNYKLKYNDKIYNYEIIDISKEYVVLENKLKKLVKIKFDCDSSKYILELYLGIGEKTNLWNYLYKKYMKGAL